MSEEQEFVKMGAAVSFSNFMIHLTSIDNETVEIEVTDLNYGEDGKKVVLKRAEIPFLIKLFKEFDEKALDTITECEHKNKSYANFSYATNPPQTPWICRDCGEEGVKRGVNFTSDYESIKSNFFRK